jgi:hypothetical protein
MTYKLHVSALYLGHLQAYIWEGVHYTLVIPIRDLLLQKIKLRWLRNHKCIVNTPSHTVYPEDGLHKGPKHVACMSYYIIIKIHWSCVWQLYTNISVLPFVFTHNGNAPRRSKSLVASVSVLLTDMPRSITCHLTKKLRNAKWIHNVVYSSNAC